MSDRRHPTRGFEPGDDRTPGPVTPPAEIRAAVAEHERDCGQAKQLWAAVDHLREEQQTMKTENASENGARKARDKMLTYFVAAIGAGTLVLQAANFIITHVAHR